MPVHPIVRQMLVCDRAAHRPGGPNKIDVMGLVHAIHVGPPRTFPYTHPELSVYIVLTGGVGGGRCRVVVTDADTDAPVFGTPTHTVQFPVDRSAVAGVVFRVMGCTFPRPGLYWVQFENDGAVIRQEPLQIR